MAKEEIPIPNGKSDVVIQQLDSETGEVVAEAKAGDTKFKEVYHADFDKGEVPKKQKEIDLTYIKKYCAQDDEKKKWFIQSYKKHQKDVKPWFNIKADFVDKYFPQLRNKKSSGNKLTMEDVFKEFEADLKIK